MRTFVTTIAIASATALTACATGPAPSDRSGMSPDVAIEEFFEGRTYAYGVFERGEVLDRRIYVELDGDWDAATRTLTLDEHFLYDDGRTQQRIWTMRQTAEGRFIATAPDVVGEAELIEFGDAAFYSYLVDLPLEDGSTVQVRFNDRLYRVGNDVRINRAEVTKFGITFGEVAFVFLKDRPSDWPEIPR